MSCLAFTVPGRPLSWQRLYNVGTGRTGDRKKLATETAAKKRIQWHALAALPPGHWTRAGAFAVEVTSYYGSAVVGDADRAAGLILDALQCPKRCKPVCLGVCWHDDRQVRDVRSRIVADGSPERVEVVVTRLDVDPVQPKRRALRTRMARADTTLTAGASAGARRGAGGSEREGPSRASRER